MICIVIAFWFWLYASELRCKVTDTQSFSFWHSKTSSTMLSRLRIKQSHLTIGQHNNTRCASFIHHTIMYWSPWRYIQSCHFIQFRRTSYIPDYPLDQHTHQDNGTFLQWHITDFEQWWRLRARRELASGLQVSSIIASNPLERKNTIWRMTSTSIYCRLPMSIGSCVTLKTYSAMVGRHYLLLLIWIGGM